MAKPSNCARSSKSFGMNPPRKSLRAVLGTAGGRSVRGSSGCLNQTSMCPVHAEQIAVKSSPKNLLGPTSDEIAVTSLRSGVCRASSIRCSRPSPGPDLPEDVKRTVECEVESGGGLCDGTGFVSSVVEALCNCLLQTVRTSRMPAISFKSRRGRCCGRKA